MASPILRVRILRFAVACALIFSSPAPSCAQESTPAASPQPAAKPEVATLRAPPSFALEDGTPVRLRLTSTLSSANAVTGQTIDFKVVEAVKVKDAVVIPEGSIAWATVTEAQHKRHLGRGGKLNITIDKVRLGDGERAPLRAVKESQGGGHVGAMTTAMVATGILFFPVAPLFLFMHGKDITIPEGTEVTAYVNGDFALDRAKFDVAPVVAATAQAQPPIALSEPPPAAAPPAAVATQSQETVEVAILSTPPNADIILDGKFVGNTPSTLRLAPGDHSVKIEKTDFKPWEKAFTVMSGAVLTLRATLEPR